MLLENNHPQRTTALSSCGFFVLGWMGMMKQIPLKSGSKYTIYTLDAASRKPRKREITFLSSKDEYRYSKITKGTRIGRYFPKNSAAALTLVIDLEGDLIVAGWDQPDVVQKGPNKLVIDGGFGVPFSLILLNWNPNFVQYKSLYFFDEIRDTEPSQVFPVQETQIKRDLQVC